MILVTAGIFIGAIDAVVGGGGLIPITALFAVYPAESAASIFGTNKSASVVGTLNVTWRNSRQVEMPWRTILPAALVVFVFSCLGAVAWLPKDAIRPLILLLLIVATVYALKHKYFGLLHRQFAWNTLVLFH